MDARVADPSEQSAPPQKTEPKAQQQAPPERLVEKFAEARRARKKEKRVKHRAKLRRSHTGG